MMRKLTILIAILILCGCQAIMPRGPELERARSAVAVALAEATTGVVVWDGPLPLEPPAVDTDETPNNYQQDDLQQAGASNSRAANESGERPAGDECPADFSTHWQTDHAAAVKLARETGKILWIHIYNDDCLPCVVVAKLFTEPPIVTRVESQFIAMQVHRHQGAGPAIVSAYKVGGNDPVDLFVYPDGTYLRYVGGHDNVADLLGRFDGPTEFAEQANWPSYPTEGNRPWTLNGRTVGVDHLLTHRNHRGKFSREWLESLSAQALAELHSDDHENTVRWEFVPPVAK